MLFKLNFDKKNKQISFIVNINNHLTDNRQKGEGVENWVEGVEGVENWAWIQRFWDTSFFGLLVLREIQH